MDKPRSEISLESWLVSAGRDSLPGAPLNVPLVPASHFILGAGRDYARDDGTPTWEALEEIVGGLESGKAVAFASGMAAIAAVFDQLAAGAVVVLPDDCHQGVAGLAAAGAERRRWFDVVGGAEVADAVCGNVRHIRHATSLGAVETTMERRAAIPGQGHLPPSLLRLSVGPY